MEGVVVEHQVEVDQEVDVAEEEEEEVEVDQDEGDLAAVEVEDEDAVGRQAGNEAGGRARELPSSDLAS